MHPTQDAQRGERWDVKLQDFKKGNAWFGQGGSVPSNDDLVFTLLLSLYSMYGVKGAQAAERARQEAAVSRDLLALHARDPASVEFYLPQLCTYLALQRFTGSPAVQACLLEHLCRSDLRFAHRTYWHLSAFCADSAEVSITLFYETLL
jgi:hypothetical protein